MTIYIHPLYQVHLMAEEYGKLYDAMVEFSAAASQYQGRLSDSEKTTLLWDIGIGRNKVEVDVLSLEFSFPDHSPSRVRYPILSTNGITALSLFLYYLRALDRPKLPFPELQS